MADILTLEILSGDKFLGTVVRRVRKDAKSDYNIHHICLSVRPSVRAHGTTLPPPGEFCEVLCWGIFLNSAEDIQVWLESDKRMDALHEDLLPFITAL